MCVYTLTQKTHRHGDSTYFPWVVSTGFTRRHSNNLGGRVMKTKRQLSNIQRSEVRGHCPDKLSVYNQKGQSQSPPHHSDSVCYDSSISSSINQSETESTTLLWLILAKKRFEFKQLHNDPQQHCELSGFYCRRLSHELIVPHHQTLKRVWGFKRQRYRQFLSIINKWEHSDLFLSYSSFNLMSQVIYLFTWRFCWVLNNCYFVGVR